jgi:geranylgeranyl reductase family protein
LAARGHGVLLLEEHDAIGYPVHCTGLMGLEAFDELPLPRESIRAVLRRACFHGPGGEPVCVETDHIRAAVIDRGEFDAALAADAIRAGATVRPATRVERIAVDEGGVSVHVGPDVRPLRARVCVLACGANYRFNRALGLGTAPLLSQSAQAEVPFPGHQHIHVYLGAAVAPEGFGWVVPFERHGAGWARLGLMCSRGARDRFMTLAARTWREHGLDAPMPQPRVKALPLAPVSRTYADRVVAVGDAAGLVKPTTGGGIYYGVLSGSIAAEVIDDAMRRDRLEAAQLCRYEQRWSARIGPDIRAGLAFRRLVSRLDDRRLTAVMELARVDGVVPLLKRHADFNSHRRAVIALLRHSAFRRAVLASLWR